MAKKSGSSDGSRVWKVIEDADFMKDFLDNEVPRKVVDDMVFERYTGNNAILPDVVYICVRNDIVDFVWKTIGKDFSPNPMGLETLECGESVIASRLSGEGIKQIDITMVGTWVQYESAYIQNEYAVFAGVIGDTQA